MKTLISNDAMRAIARKTLERETGARGLRSIMENLLRRYMFEIPSRQAVSSCLVDEAAVNGEADIHITESEEDVAVAAGG